MKSLVQNISELRNTAVMSNDLKEKEPQKQQPFKQMIKFMSLFSWSWGLDVLIFSVIQTLLWRWPSICCSWHIILSYTMPNNCSSFQSQFCCQAVRLQAILFCVFSFPYLQWGTRNSLPGLWGWMKPFSRKTHILRKWSPGSRIQGKRRDEKSIKSPCDQKLSLKIQTCHFCLPLCSHLCLWRYLFTENMTWVAFIWATDDSWERIRGHILHKILYKISVCILPVFWLRTMECLLIRK